MTSTTPPTSAPVYLDNHATTPLDPRVLDAMLPFFREHFGNASSSRHAYGWVAKDAVEDARAQVARAIGATAKEVVFTSGATESNNLAILGAVRALRDKHPSRTKVVTCLTEHSAVLDACRLLEDEGCQVVMLEPGTAGVVDVELLQPHLDDTVALVSLMAVNNEVGVIHPIAQLAKATKEVGAVFHTDATQALGRIPVDVNAWHVDLLSLTGHKLYGPKGCGALYVRKKPKVQVHPLLVGGGQERGLRSGTTNVPGVVGLGAACALAVDELDQDVAHIRHLRELLLPPLLALGGVHLNGDDERRVDGNLNLYIEGTDSEELLLRIHKDVACSAGSACSSKNAKPSHVLRGLNLGNDRARASIRLGIGRMNTEDDIRRAVDVLTAAIHDLRAGT